MKLVLDATTKSITAVLGGAVATTQPDFTAHYADATATAFTEGANDGTLNSTTPVTLVAAPAASTRRVIVALTIVNRDTVAVVLTINYVSASGTRVIWTGTVSAGATWTLDTNTLSLDHALMTHLAYADAGHTGFQPTITTEVSGPIASHAALITGVHGLVFTAGKTLTLTESLTLNALPIGGLAVATGANALGSLAVGLTTQVLVGGGAGTVPAWAADLPTAVTIGSGYIYRAGGTDVPVADGGTGASTLALNGVLFGNAANAVGVTAIGAQYQVLTVGATPFVPAFSSYLLDGTAGGKTILAVTNTKTLTLTATDNAGLTFTGASVLTVPATGTAALLNQANSFTLINPLTTIAESWIGPSSTTGIYFKAGNVGIGTTSPGSILEIYKAASGAVGPILTLNNPASNPVTGSAIDFKGADSASQPITARIVTTADSNWSSNIDFQTKAQSSGGALGSKLYIQSSGNVGIGTTGPGSYDTTGNKLVIAGTSTTGITIASGNTSTGTILFADGLTGGDPYVGGIKYDHNLNKMYLWSNMNYPGSASGNELTISSGNVGIGTILPDRLFHAEVSDAVTNAIAYAQRLSHITSGTAAAGFGTGIEGELEDDTGTNRIAAYIEWLWNDPATAAYKGDLILKAVDSGGTREGLRIRGSGTAPMIGFLGTAISARIAHVADANAAYGAGDLDTEAEIISALNTTNGKINSILATLEGFGFHATA